jgi:hypothetical protein
MKEKYQYVCSNQCRNVAVVNEANHEWRESNEIMK